VRRDEMPPADSPTGPLSPAQKDVIRAWIAAGAPSAAITTPQANRPLSDSDESQATAQLAASQGLPKPSLLSSLPRRLSAFHILVVHFPIALLISAALAELLSTWRGTRVPSPTVRFCVLLGAAGAVAAAALGWLHAWNGYGAGMPLTLS